jgi:hypothetical protein
MKKRIDRDEKPASGPNTEGGFSLPQIKGSEKSPQQKGTHYHGDGSSVDGIQGRKYSRSIVQRISRIAEMRVILSWYPNAFLGGKPTNLSR